MGGASLSVLASPIPPWGTPAAAVVQTVSQYRFNFQNGKIKRKFFINMNSIYWLTSLFILRWEI